jgi:hypothetical protein
MGLLLRTKRHTATGKQIQVLVAAVNRHMPATPSKCCRRRRVRCARLIRPFMIEGSIVRCMIPALAGLVPERGKWRRPRLECVSVWYTFLLVCDSGIAASGDWVGGLQWIALLYMHSSRKCAAPRLLSPKPSRESHRPRLNLPSRAWVPNPLSRLGRPLQSVATRDGWPPAERHCPPRGFFRKRQNSERPEAARRIYSRPRSHLRAAAAMIGRKSVPVSTGYWGIAKTGTCSWGRAGPNLLP